ncbi:hypothetical protein C8Q74DRAFT_1248026, partial [Fomes fomentarius]
MHGQRVQCVAHVHGRGSPNASTVMVGVATCTKLSVPSLPALMPPPTYASKSPRMPRSWLEPFHTSGLLTLVRPSSVPRTMWWLRLSNIEELVLGEFAFGPAPLTAWIFPPPQPYPGWDACLEFTDSSVHLLFSGAQSASVAIIHYEPKLGLYTANAASTRRKKYRVGSGKLRLTRVSTAYGTNYREMSFPFRMTVTGTGS